MKKIIFSQYGRSMVEMLGVLAIIGVLSVGSISGYSKAMMRYKLNKFTTSMNELLNTCIQYTGQLYSALNNTDSDDGTEYFSTILHKMNALPDGITYENNTYLKDMFGNLVWPYYNPQPFYGLGYELSKNGNNNLSSEICHQLVKIAKENSSQLENILIYAGETTLALSYGDSYCSKDTQCIKSMKLSDIDTTCHSCQQDSDCRFYFIWK